MPFLRLFLFVVALPVFANENSTSDYRIAVIDHPFLVQLFKPTIDHAYRSIGIKPTYVATPSFRGLVEVDKGTMDADLFRLDQASLYVTHAIKVPVSLGKVNVVLYCRGKLTVCSEKVLDDPDKRVLVVKGAKVLQGILQDKAIDRIEVGWSESFEQLIAMQDINYFINFEHENGARFVAVNDSLFNSHTLFTSDLFHFVTDKHEKLVPTLRKSLEHSLKLIPVGEVRENYTSFQ